MFNGAYLICFRLFGNLFFFKTNNAFIDKLRALSAHTEILSEIAGPGWN